MFSFRNLFSVAYKLRDIWTSEYDTRPLTFITILTILA